MGKHTNFILILVLCCSISACIRYVPARSELNSGQSSEQIAQSNLLGAEAFYANEKMLKDRVEALVKARGNLALNPSTDTYRLGAGDILEFDVSGLPNLHSEVEISPSGTALFPLINGEVLAKDKSLFELKSDLASRLSRFIKNPQVRLNVKEFQAHKVAVTGAVAKPGLYPLRRGAPMLSELIAEAGGRTEKAGNRVMVMPPASTTGDSNSGFAVEIDFEDLIGSAVARPLIIPVIGGDTIIVPEAGTYEVEGEVKTPGSYKITSKKSVMGAIAGAGGFGYAAKVDEVEVIRDIGGGKKAYVALNLEDIALKGQDDVRVRDGDLVRVPTESGRHTKRQIVETLNSIFRGVGVQGQVR